MQFLSRGVVTATLVLTTVALSLASGAGAPRLARWEDAGALSTPRAHATSVALPSGEILVLGGLDLDAPELALGTTELYDPVFKRSLVLGDHLVGRLNQTATLTASGDVIVVGGTLRAYDDWIATNTVDVFLATSQRWVRRRSLAEPRSDHGAVTLADGRVLVTGGNDGTKLKLSTEIYDPARDRWTYAAPLPVGRTQFSIARLPDGRVLVAGGIENGKPSASTLLYDPSADRWSAGPSLSVARVLHTMVTLRGGDVLLIGGQEAAAPTAERYDVATGQWVFAGRLREPRELAQAAALADGRVIVSGGLAPSTQRHGFKPMRTSELWDPLRAVWSPTSDAPSARALGSLVQTSAGIFRLGGLLEDERAPQSIESFSWAAR